MELARSRRPRTTSKRLKLRWEADALGHWRPHIKVPRGKKVGDVFRVPARKLTDFCWNGKTGPEGITYAPVYSGAKEENSFKDCILWQRPRTLNVLPSCHELDMIPCDVWEAFATYSMLCSAINTHSSSFTCQKENSASIPRRALLLEKVTNLCVCDSKEKHHPIDRHKQRLGTKSHTTGIPFYTMKMLCGAVTAAQGFPLRN